MGKISGFSQPGADPFFHGKFAFEFAKPVSQIAITLVEQLLSKNVEADVDEYRIDGSTLETTLRETKKEFLRREFV